MTTEHRIFGEGVYSPRQAARLIGTSSQNVLRWTRGSGPSLPLWRGYYQSVNDAQEVSFADLIDLRIVVAFRKVGLTLQAIRFAIEKVKEVLKDDRPLNSYDFRTDGGSIMAELSDGNLVSLSKAHLGQKIFGDVIRQSLKDVEYDGGRAARWRPAFAPGIVIDPSRQFGDPLLDSFGIASRVLADEVSQGRSVSYVSRLYEIAESDVRQALKFERELDRQHEKLELEGAA